MTRYGIVRLSRTSVLWSVFSHDGDESPLLCTLRDVSLDDLVPQDRFYRQVERSLDLSFVRDLVTSCYAPIGRPSVDPVVFFKLQLAMFFEGLRSERLLMEVAVDRLSLRWFLGYDLHEKLPDHSSLSTIRDRYGITIFRQFFDHIVEQCQQAGLIWGKELYFDSTRSKPTPTVTRCCRASMSTL